MYGLIYVLISTIDDIKAVVAFGIRTTLFSFILHPLFGFFHNYKTYLAFVPLFHAGFTFFSLCRAFRDFGAFFFFVVIIFHDSQFFWSVMCLLYANICTLPMLLKIVIQIL